MATTGAGGRGNPSEAFIAELRHWREVAGMSQKALAGAVGYDPSYVSKVERGSVMPSRSFAESADQHMRAGRALIRRWNDLHGSTVRAGPQERATERGAPDDPQSAPGPSLIVEHELAELSYIETGHGPMWRTHIRRQLHNVGTEPVTQYLIRIAVDRFPGEPERSNRLYREDPLTWDEVGLRARSGDEAMTWSVKHDRDAFKELWLLFENEDGRFPLYPGDSTWIDYTYTVAAHKWGPWWQRAIRLPTRRLSMAIDFPATLDPALWGMETSMSAEAHAFRTPIRRDSDTDRAIFTWSTEDPPLHARYRIEWKFRTTDSDMDKRRRPVNPADKMRELGIIQEGATVLSETAQRFDLPRDAEDVRRALARITATMERVRQVHNFSKGMGLAAPQVNLSRAMAVVRTPSGESLTLINPRIIEQSTDGDEQYEGCLSFFDVRGMVPRPHTIEVEHQTIEGETRITVFERGIARLVCHEIDHLHGVLYRTRMRPGMTPIPVSQYRGTGTQWSYPTS
ncbi:peptide deformylase [Actinokineospora spheciospongiae]|uniref:peptide deformylase n=1 Tax=Actinokineospora spheciospongiae TaxID=909613 RepID=UPI00054EDA08|nr:peptide deformylase [Actinokineospora spheciospongiae]